MSLPRNGPVEGAVEVSHDWLTAIPHVKVTVPATESGPADSWVPWVGRVNLAQAAETFGLSIFVPATIPVAVAETAAGSFHAIPCQIDSQPDDEGPPETLALLLPGDLLGESLQVYVFFIEGEQPVMAVPDVGQVRGRWTHPHAEVFRVENDHYLVEHSRVLGGGLPSRIKFPNGPDLEYSIDPTQAGFHLHDSLTNEDLGNAGLPTGYALMNDAAPTVEGTTGAIRVGVRVAAQYLTGNGDVPDSAPAVVYEFHYFAGTPIVLVTARLRQNSPVRWSAAAFLLFRFHDHKHDLFDRWWAHPGAPDDAPLDGVVDLHHLSDDRVSSDLLLWGALRSTGGRSSLAFLGLGSGRLFDGGPEDVDYQDYYLSGPTFVWDTPEQRLDGALWIHSGDKYPVNVDRASHQVRDLARATVSTEPLDVQLAEIAVEIDGVGDTELRGRFAWLLDDIRRRIARDGELARAAERASFLAWMVFVGMQPGDDPGWLDEDGEDVIHVDNGEVGLALGVGDHGVSLRGLYDLQLRQELLTGAPQAPFSFELFMPDGDGNQQQNLVRPAAPPPPPPLAVHGGEEPGEDGEFSPDDPIMLLAASTAPPDVPGEPYYIFGDSGWDNVQVDVDDGENGEPVVTITLSHAKQHPKDVLDPLFGLSVTLTITFEGPLTLWSLEIGNLTGGMLRNVRCPRAWTSDLSSDDGDDSDSLLVPYRPGTLRSSPLRRPQDVFFDEMYPSGKCTIPLFARMNPEGGLYLAVHDPLAQIKYLSSSLGQPDLVRGDSVWLEVNWPVENRDEGGHGFAMDRSHEPDEDGQLRDVDVRAVLGAVRGDWYDAAQTYRAWAEQGVSGGGAWWWPAEGESGRPDTPQWMHDTSLWLLVFMGQPEQDMVGVRPPLIDPATGVNEVANLASELVTQAGLTDPSAIGVHLYHWMLDTANRTFPWHFPAEDVLTGVMTELRDAELTVVPYVNARLVYDKNLTGVYEGNSLTGSEQVAFPALREESGSPELNPVYYTESYRLRQKTLDHFVMCPTEAGWREKLIDFVIDPLLGPNYAADGVYLDQMSSAEPTPCYHANHAHPHGGGSWWTREGYWPFARTLRDLAAPANRVLTSEDAAEPYFKQLDGCVVWTWDEPDQVPLLPAVYGGKIALFGRTYHNAPDAEGFAAKLGQSFVFGEQLGWFKPSEAGQNHSAVVDDTQAQASLHLSASISDQDWEDDLKPYLAQLLRLRHETRGAYQGRMARPPVLQWTGQPGGAAPRVSSNWGDATEVSCDAVLSSAWQQDDGKLTILLVNVSDEIQVFTHQFDGERYGFGPQSNLLRRDHTYWPGVGYQIDLENVQTSFSRLISLAPYRAVVIEFEDEGAGIGGYDPGIPT